MHRVKIAVAAGASHILAEAATKQGLLEREVEELKSKLAASDEARYSVYLLYWCTRTNTDAEGASDDSRKLAEVDPLKLQKLFGLLGGMEGKAAASAAQGDKLWPLLGEQFTCVTGIHVPILTQKALRFAARPC